MRGEVEAKVIVSQQKVLPELDGETFATAFGKTGSRLESWVVISNMMSTGIPLTVWGGRNSLWLGSGERLLMLTYLRSSKPRQFYQLLML